MMLIHLYIVMDFTCPREDFRLSTLVFKLKYLFIYTPYVPVYVTVFLISLSQKNDTFPYLVIFWLYTSHFTSMIRFIVTQISKACFRRQISTMYLIFLNLVCSQTRSHKLDGYCFCWILLSLVILLTFAKFIWFFLNIVLHFNESSASRHALLLKVKQAPFVSLRSTWWNLADIMCFTIVLLVYLSGTLSRSQIQINWNMEWVSWWKLAIWKNQISFTWRKIDTHQQCIEYHSQILSIYFPPSYEGVQSSSS